MVQLPEDKSSLIHMVPGYDPAKAHAYYLRTRHLHPRRRGTDQPISTRSGPTQTKRAIPAPAAAQLARQRAQAAAAVQTLTNKLSELKSVLARKKAALNRDRKTQHKTAAEKSKAARESKQYRQKHRQELKTKREHQSGSGGSSTKGVIDNPRSGSIKQVEAAIQTVQKALTAAKARQQALG